MNSEDELQQVLNRRFVKAMVKRAKQARARGTLIRAKGAASKGSAHPRSKYTESQVISVRSALEANKLADGDTGKLPWADIAEIHNMTIPAVKKLAAVKHYWPHCTPDPEMVRQWRERFVEARRNARNEKRKAKVMKIETALEQRTMSRVELNATAQETADSMRLRELLMENGMSFPEDYSACEALLLELMESAVLTPEATVEWFAVAEAHFYK